MQRNRRLVALNLSMMAMLSCLGGCHRQPPRDEGVTITLDDPLPPPARRYEVVIDEPIDAASERNAAEAEPARPGFSFQD